MEPHQAVSPLSTLPLDSGTHQLAELVTRNDAMKAARLASVQMAKHELEFPGFWCLHHGLRCAANAQEPVHSGNMLEAASVPAETHQLALINLAEIVMKMVK